MKPLHVRLAAWGSVLVAAAVAFNLRAGTEGADAGANGPQLNGRTSQHLPMWVVAGDQGRVREIRMAWRFRCERGGTIAPFGMVARAGTAGFEAHGSRFTFEDSRELPHGDGETVHVHVRLAGTAERGRTSAEVRFGEAGMSCRSGPVRWTAAAG